MAHVPDTPPDAARSPKARGRWQEAVRLQDSQHEEGLSPVRGTMSTASAVTGTRHMGCMLV